MEEHPYPVTVLGEWGTIPPKTIKNKLQIYFQSKKKSGGGDCRVECTGAGTTIRFKSEDVRKRVIAQEDHELTVENANVKLQLFLCKENPEDAVHGAEGGDIRPAEPGVPGEEEGSSAVLLEKVPEQLSRETLTMMVESICNKCEEEFCLEMIQHRNAAVVTFSDPSGVCVIQFAAGFLGCSSGHGRFQQYGLGCRALGPSCSVRVEGLPPQAGSELLEMYFEMERQGGGPVADIALIPEEQAAIITFQDPRVAEAVLQRKHEICRVEVSVFPFRPELGTALYGRARSEWTLPEAFSQSLQPALARFLQQPGPLADLTSRMRPLFCQVELGPARAELRPTAGLLARPGQTPGGVAAWRGAATAAFSGVLAQYGCVECSVSAPVWREAELQIRQAADERDVLLLPDLPRGALALAGRAEALGPARQEVEELLQGAARRHHSVSEEVQLAPAEFHLLQPGLAQAHPALTLQYRAEAGCLRLQGLPSEVSRGKSGVLERLLALERRPLQLEAGLEGFLRAADGERVTRDLLTSRGAGVALRVDGPDLLLLGPSGGALSRAQTLLTDALGARSLQAEDPAVLRSPQWAELKSRLSAAHGPRVSVREDGRGGVGVAGLADAVQGVADALGACLRERARVEEAEPLRSVAVMRFLQKFGGSDWQARAEAQQVSVRFQAGRRPRVLLAGARLQVQALRSLFARLDSALCTQQLSLAQPGARRAFLEMEGVLDSVTRSRKCVVVLQEEEEEEEEEEELCRVRAEGGVLVTVRRADLTRVEVDGVVNAANEDLQHMGGLAGALLRAAGPALQEASDAYVRTHGRLRPGDAVATPAGRLPCRLVLHAVGPRYSRAESSLCVQQLGRAVSRSLELAQTHRCSSLALPAISSGLFGFPLQLCAQTIARAVRQHCQAPRPAAPTLTHIQLVNNDHKTAQAMARAVETAFADLRPQAPSQPSRERSPPQAAEWNSQRDWSSGHSRDRPSESRGELETKHTEEGQATVLGKGRSPPQAAEWNSQRDWSSGHSRDRPSESRGELETKHTKEGLAIVLRKGNIQDASTDVIVNSVAQSLDLSQGAVSNAILQAAGASLQGALQGQRAQYGDVLHTPGYNLNCHIYHCVCPSWDGGTGDAQQKLIHMVQKCLSDAEQHRMQSLAFPAIGTGNLGFPRDLVARILLSEALAFSQRRAPSHLRSVLFLVHPSDTQTVECFLREFRGQAQGHKGPDPHPSSLSQQEKSSTAQPKPAFFGQISSPAREVYSMSIGPLTLQVCSGDITRENTDIIVNSSNSTFNLHTGVSKAILEAAGVDVEEECTRSGSQPNSGLIVTRGGGLSCRNIVHIVVPSEPPRIRDLVVQVLQVCEDMKRASVAFPALGTGQGNTKPPLVAEAMISAVTDFVRKNTKPHLKFVKIVIFQTEIMSHFHKSMKKREGGGPPAEKGLLTKVVDAVGSFFLGGDGASRGAEGEAKPVLEAKFPPAEFPPAEFPPAEFSPAEFPPAVFQLCGESMKAVADAQAELKRLLMKEQTERILQDPAIAHLSPRQRHALQGLQHTLTVRIQLQGPAGAPQIHLEGLTRDVATAEDQIRQMIREAERAERAERDRMEAVQLLQLVGWQHDHKGMFEPFDVLTNRALEKAYENQQSCVSIRLNDLEYEADLGRMKACRVWGNSSITLRRVEKKESPPSSRAGVDLGMRSLQQGSAEYQDVVSKVKLSGIANSIVEVAEVQNAGLWKTYKQKKKTLDRRRGPRSRERWLFHSSSAPHINQINQQGFTPNATANSHPAPYGRGIYFCEDPNTALDMYSKADAQGHKHVYLALVLPGEYTQGGPSMASPPQLISGNHADLYDSVVDNPAKPTVFVIFDGSQAYPKYLIKLK
ncbi:protein mono-ADP-ribosyltransferase PARP14 [Conger conger]|uniref:protein mono-ADP-ribosyltransferase PARP14 n=1 Tax=Conger conger TaxID=82655 RepID=UPI002A5A865B|nr:protein mono-ADP-ribosyltransferase PARP14 [Conger conger]